MAPILNSIMPLSHVENVSICGTDNTPCVAFLEFSVAAALNRVYALRHTHSVSSVNLSLLLSEFWWNFTSAVCDTNWPAVRDAVNLLTGAGIRVYGASGNLGSRTGFGNKIAPPSCIDNVISVGATSKNSHDFAPYSNVSGILDLLAPGGLTGLDDRDFEVLTCPRPFWLFRGILSAHYQFNCSDDYYQTAGTSMASPHAAGAHLVLQSRYPTASARAISDWMIASGTPISFSQITWNDDPSTNIHYTKPRLNLAAAMAPPTAPASGPASGSVNWMACFGNNAATWASVPGNVTEYQLQGASSQWTYYTGTGTAALVWVSQSESLRVRACNMVACGPWTTIGHAIYQPHCH